MRVVRTRRGARLVHDGHVVSEVLAKPGPTHSVFDALAACVAALGRGGRVAMLGFAGGGMIAPLRAMGCAVPVDAVDLTTSAEPLFRELSGAWAGEVNLDEGEASAWLRARRAKDDVVIEDLSMQIPRDVTKPPVSLEVLPDLIAPRVRAGAIAVVNVLPVPGWSMRALLEHLARGYPDVRVVALEDFSNRILVGARRLPPARDLSRRIRSLLDGIGSTQAAGVSVRSPR